MAVEVPPATVNLRGLRPQPHHPDLPQLPFYLWRGTLMAIRSEEGTVPPNLWNARGAAVEVRTKRIIESQTQIVENVTLNAQYAEGSDLTIVFVPGFRVREVKVEVKSSTDGKRRYKQQLRDKMFKEESSGQLIGLWTRKLARVEWNRLSDKQKEAAISKRLTQDRIILINGGEEDYKEKTPQEILNDSFYPQLERLWLDLAPPKPTEAVPEIPNPDQIQIWPSLSSSEPVAPLSAAA